MAAEHRPQLVTLLKKFTTTPIVGVEVGVHRGETSAAMLRAINSLNLFMVDLWTVPPQDSPYWKTADPCARLEPGRIAQNKANARKVTAFAGRRHTILQMDSVAALEKLPPTLDMAFIDADHSYEGALRDMHAYWPRVRSGGLFSGHDYYTPEQRQGKKFHVEGVGQAVDEFFADKGLEFSLGSGTVWWVWKK